MVYVYCPWKSNGAFDLVRALGAHRLRKFDGIDFWDKRTRYVLKDGDVIVCWGMSVPEFDGVRVLNGLDQPLTVVKKWETLMQRGVPTVQAVPGGKASGLLIPRLQRQLDLTNAQLSVIRDNFPTEYRIHSFDGRSIQAGVKIPRDGFTVCPESDWVPDANLAHPWIRSFVGGWRVNYDFKSTADLRRLAHRAVATLGLTFGAVDIGMRADKVLRVLDVDQAPRLEGWTIASYTRAVNRWIKKGEQNDSGGVSVGEPVSDVEDVESEPDYGDGDGPEDV